MSSCSFASPKRCRESVFCPFSRDEANELLENGDLAMRGTGRRAVRWLLRLLVEFCDCNLCISPDRCRRTRLRLLSLLPLERSLVADRLLPLERSLRSWPGLLALER